MGFPALPQPAHEPQLIQQRLGCLRSKSQRRLDGRTGSDTSANFLSRVLSAGFPQNVRPRPTVRPPGDLHTLLHRFLPRGPFDFPAFPATPSGVTDAHVSVHAFCSFANTPKDVGCDGNPFPKNVPRGVFRQHPTETTEMTSGRLEDASRPPGLRPPCAAPGQPVSATRETAHQDSSSNSASVSRVARPRAAPPRFGLRPTLTSGLTTASNPDSTGREARGQR